MNPKVSVIIPVWNREGLISRCLDSVKSQDYHPIEIIVVDNGSTDGTLKAIEEWKNSNLNLLNSEGFELRILSEMEKGAWVARQKGLENATGDYIIFFDSDDAMRSCLVSTAMEVAENNRDADVICWPCIIHQLDGSHKIPPFMPGNIIEGHLIHTLFRPQGSLLKKEFIEKTGGWKNNLPVWDDFELGLRIILNHGKVAGVNKVLADIYAQEESITGTNFISKSGLWEKTINVMKEENNLSGHEDKEKIDKILTYREAILAAHYSREGNVGLGKKLMYKVLRDKKRLQKMLLQFTYHYTRKGGRGAWRIIRGIYL